MTPDYDSMIAKVIAREGGSTYTDYSADAGGPTKYGITLAALHEWRQMPVSAEDVRDLTEQEAVRIYRARYFPKWFELIKPEGVVELLFDYSVNSGVGGVTLGVQNILKNWAFYQGGLDGDFGPMSQAALGKVANWEAFFYAVKCERLESYLRYIGRDQRQAMFAGGWANRSDQFELNQGMLTS